MTQFDEDARWLVVDRGPYRLTCNFASAERAVPVSPDHGEVVLATSGDGVQLDDGQIRLPALSGALVR